MRGEDQGAATGCQSLIDEMLVVNLRRQLERLPIEIRHPEQLENRLAEVVEHVADGVAVLLRRPVGEGNGDIRQRAVAIWPQGVPTPLAEKNAEGPDGAQRNALGDDTERAERKSDDASSTCSELEVSHA